MSGGPIAGQAVLVVGGTSGIGLAVAEELVEQGARVSVVSRSADRVESALQHLGEAEGYVADTSAPDTLARVVAGLPDLDHVVSCAGQGAGGALLDVDLESVRHAWETKVIGQLHVARAVAARLPAHGSLTLFGGLYGKRVAPGVGAVAMANSAVEVLARTLALELAPVRVNAIAPGLVDTPAYAAMPDDAREAMFAGVASALPTGRVGRAEDLVPPVLACLTSGFLTGTVLRVDGGGAIA